MWMLSRFVAKLTVQLLYLVRGNVSFQIGLLHGFVVAVWALVLVLVLVDEYVPIEMPRMSSFVRAM